MNLFIQKESLSIMVRCRGIDGWVGGGGVSKAVVPSKLFDAVFQNDPCQFTSESFYVEDVENSWESQIGTSVKDKIHDQ